MRICLMQGNVMSEVYHECIATRLALFCVTVRHRISPAWGRPSEAAFRPRFQSSRRIGRSCVPKRRGRSESYCSHLIIWFARHWLRLPFMDKAAPDGTFCALAFELM
jgi:hypothetical protein